MNFIEKIGAEKRSGFEFERKSLTESILREKNIALIAEIKRKSPSQGTLRDIDPANVAGEMESAGACAISVLTEGRYFGGNIRDLADVKRSVKVPVLRKDFIVDLNQLSESVLYGADAVLLIASVLKEETVKFVEAAHNIGLESLVEVHDEADLTHALESTALMIGINNRDLRTLKVDLETTELLASLVPKNRIIVAESGVADREDVLRMKKAGARAVLVGTSIMKSNNIKLKITELIGK